MAKPLRYTKTRAVLASEVKLRPENTTRIIYLRRQLKADFIADWLENKLAEAPFLSDEQIAIIGALLDDAPRRRGGAA